MKRSFEPKPVALGVRAALLVASMPSLRVTSSPAPPKPKPPIMPLLDAMGAEEMLRYLSGPGHTDDPLVRRLAELLELQLGIRDDDAVLAEEALREVERRLDEAQGRIRRLEGVLEDEDVPRELWAE